MSDPQTTSAPALLDPSLVDVAAQALHRRCHPNRLWAKTHPDHQAMWRIDAHAALIAICAARPDVAALLREGYARHE